MTKYILLLLLISTFLHAKDVTLLLSWKHQFQFAGYYMAQEMGYYKDVGLNLAIKEHDLKGYVGVNG
jgi:ABC-type nitrate/sulfonate/bicarbonate transport system substrate-binding protein